MACVNPKTRISVFPREVTLAALRTGLSIAKLVTSWLTVDTEKCIGAIAARPPCWSAAPAIVRTGFTYNDAATGATAVQGKVTYVPTRH